MNGVKRIKLHGRQPLTALVRAQWAAGSALQTGPTPLCPSPRSQYQSHTPFIVCSLIHHPHLLLAALPPISHARLAAAATHTRAALLRAALAAPKPRLDGACVRHTLLLLPWLCNTPKAEQTSSTSPVPSSCCILASPRPSPSAFILASPQEPSFAFRPLHPLPDRLLLAQASAHSFEARAEAEAQLQPCVKSTSASPMPTRHPSASPPPSMTAVRSTAPRPCR